MVAARLACRGSWLITRSISFSVLDSSGRCLTGPAEKKISLIGKSQHRGALMKITLDKKVVELKPESPQEAQELDALWKVIIDCNNTNKKLVAIGDYMPGEKEIARFHIED